MNFQKNILAEIPGHARFLEFSLKGGDGSVDRALLVECLSGGSGLENCVVGFGLSLVEALGGVVPGLEDFPALQGGGISVPATQADLWICVRGEERGAVVNQSRGLEVGLSSGFERQRLVDGFRYDIGRDLTGYEDGTENPQGEDAIKAAFVRGQGAGLDGGSFVAVQQWLHDFNAFDAMSEGQQDNLIGRYRRSNEEFDAPDSAHVKRTAQESFDPEAFVLRRSMPWSDGTGSGLMFVAFGHSFYGFAVQMEKMIGRDDGIVDGLFEFTMPISGSYFWCPPVKQDGLLDLSGLGMD